MLFHRWHPFPNSLPPAKHPMQRSKLNLLKLDLLKLSPLKLGLLSSVSFLVVLLSQSQALAFHQVYDHGDKLPRYGRLIYLTIGVFLGGVLTVESRRLKTFLFGLLLSLSGLWALALLIHYRANLPYPTELWLYSVMGFAIGIIPIGLWWWGHRQGYVLAIFNLLFCRDSADPILKRLLAYYEPEHNSDESAEKAEAPLGFFKWIKYQAAVVRYYRMFDQGELYAVGVLVSDRIQDHWQKKQAQQQAQKKQETKAAIESLLSQATEHLDKAPL